mmetsp:Transcript_17792/g.24607  ORF Transcript_17792/g.24607 Transcript_17792/m.24607 type:complete len:169 (+) Transcript_17792:87-593(+)|eukprot:CAMPEP_0196579582 /NCGR_PEP_ID=MMETSP1081-20130531/23135_1 /TAXON_ID=36882 /ORGANISM="Pyramimonas amylifera, Strain CCMP720" /LENGTH=168 /DNA_ID=CAMNT_0041899211 /DNA_START=74 /DNA_END=580 /DNA_ORIENTATION=-
MAFSLVASKFSIFSHIHNFENECCKHGTTPVQVPVKRRSTSVTCLTNSKQRLNVSRSRNSSQFKKLAIPEVAEEAPLAVQEAVKLDKGMFVRVNEEKFNNSVEALASHTNKLFTGLAYIFEDRGEILEVRTFSKGDYALVVFVGVPSSPSWLPVNMLEKVDKLVYQRV